jgi:DMSO reductase anchor subunit
MALLTFLPLVCSAWLSLFEDRYAWLPGLLGTAGAVVTVYCTAMIYASLKSIDAWHTRLTPLCYLLFAAAGGTVLGGFFNLAAGGAQGGLAFAGILLLAAAWGAKIAWWRRLRSLEPTSTPESATGLGSIGRVRLFERPHTNDNYLTREMGFVVARKHAEKLTRLAVVNGGALPAALLAIVAVAGSGWQALLLQAIAVLLFAAGIAVERWLFFAEARHAVTNYYEPDWPAVRASGTTGGRTISRARDSG